MQATASSPKISVPLQATAKRRNPFWFLVPALIVCAIIAIGSGALPISPLQVLSILGAKIGLPPIAEYNAQQEAVLYAIRLPRVLLALLVGAGLAVSGAALQGLFRNPLADPGLLGISSGASLFVSGSIVLNIAPFGIYSPSVAAFIGSTLSTLAIYALAQQDRKTNIATMLLAGIAINALCSAGTGLFTYLSEEDQLRLIVFWQLGSLGGATWTALVASAPFILLCVVAMPFLASSLNALLLGETNARHLGISVEVIKSCIVVLIALGVGAGVAVAGMIGFVGLVVPHLVRLWAGPNHRVLLPASALLGATLLVLADLLARTIVQPAELPIGLVTAFVGAPFFLYLLFQSKKPGVL
jgi:iron complex transport system permease protein